MTFCHQEKVVRFHDRNGYGITLEFLSCEGRQVACRPLLHRQIFQSPIEEKRMFIRAVERRARPNRRQDWMASPLASCKSKHGEEE